jgi:hypothetical protein
VTALGPMIGYDKASAIAHKANDEGLTLKEAALQSSDIDEERFDEVLALGYPLRKALTIGAALSQIGEFSFILAGLGVDLQLLPPTGRDLILAGAIGDAS